MQAPDPTAVAGFGRGLLATRRRRQVGPATEIRAALTACRDSCQDVINRTGVDAGYFNPANAHDQRLKDLSDRPRSKELRALLNQVADTWRMVFASAPAPRPPRVYNLLRPDAYAAEDAPAKQQMERQVGDARRGLASVEAALSCLNRLEQKAIF